MNAVVLGKYSEVDPQVDLDKNVFGMEAISLISHSLESCNHLQLICNVESGLSWHLPVLQQ